MALRAAEQSPQACGGARGLRLDASHILTNEGVSDLLGGMHDSMELYEA